MSEPGAIVDAQLRHLLEVVKKNRDKRCAELLQQAAEQVGEILRQAHRDARLHMRQAVTEARDAVRQQLASADAQRQTEQRQRRQRADKALLLEAWPVLREALASRWRDAASRRCWVEDLLAQAAASLVDRHWLIEHPTDWPPADRAAVTVELTERFGHQPRFSAQSDIAAGLRISAGGACVDGTLDGLLCERAAIEAALLSAMRAYRQAAS